MNTYTKIAVLLGTIGIVMGGLLVSGTAAYPAIMISRQMQSLRECTFGSPYFKTTDYGFSFSVPEGYCVLPNRLFPADGSIEIVPKGLYFVFNEYAQGTIANASRVSILFEPTTPTRDPQHILATLVAGRFLDGHDIQSTTTPSGIAVTLANNVLGTDNERYDWALTTHPDSAHFVLVIAKHGSDHSVRNFILHSISSLPTNLTK